MKHIVFFILTLCMISCIKDQKLKIDLNTIPDQLNDDWEISTPENEGFNQEKLDLAINAFFSESQLHNSKALLIARNNKLVLEAYCRSLEDRNRLHNIKSVTKSITSILTGIAIQNDFLDSNLNQLVYNVIPENFDDNESKRAITLLHCLTMTTGLEDPFYSVSSILPDNSVSTCLGVDLIYEPGEVHEYNNGSANIIGGIIRKQTGMKFENFARDYLFNVIGIEDYHWVKHNDGNVNPAFDLFLKPRDMVKFGQFCLRNGQWNGQQITPEYWINQSTQEYENGFDGPFGFHWWVLEKYNGYYANGHGGQRIWILPDHDLVIVHIAEPSTDQTNLDEIEMLFELIMDAI